MKLTEEKILDEISKQAQPTAYSVAKALSAGSPEVWYLVKHLTQTNKVRKKQALSGNGIILEVVK